MQAVVEEVREKGDKRNKWRVIESLKEGMGGGSRVWGDKVKVWGLMRRGRECIKKRG